MPLSNLSTYEEARQTLTPEELKRIRRMRLTSFEDAEALERMIIEQKLADAKTIEARNLISGEFDPPPIPTKGDIRNTAAEIPEETPIDLSGLDIDTRFGMPKMPEKKPTTITMPEEVPEAPPPMSLQQKRELFASKGMMSNPIVKDYMGVQENLQTRQPLEEYATRGEMDDSEREALKALIDANKLDDAVKMIVSKQRFGEGYGKSSVGAALEFTKQNPELVQSVLETVEMMKNSGRNYDPILLKSIENFAKTDVRRAQDMLSNQLFKPETARVTEQVTRPEKIQTAAGTAGASTAARIETEREVGKTLPAGTAIGLGDFEASLGQLKILSESFSNPDAPQGPISQIRKANPYDWQAQAKQQLIATTKQLIGKALEGGVLRKEDEEKYEKILPKMADTYMTAVEKTNNLYNMINNKYKEQVGGLKKAGYYTEEFEKGMEEDDDPLGIR